jgi:hypothetical protein
MKRQTTGSKYTGDERIRSSDSSWLKKILESSKGAPSIINKDSIKSVSKPLASEVKTELNVAISQIFGIELKAGTAVTLKKNQEESEKNDEKVEVIEAHREYFSEFKKDSESKKTSEDTIAIKQSLESILAELKNLKDSSDELETVFKDVTIDEVPEKPGVYHLTFYEGFLKLVLSVRDKIEDATIFAKLFKNRKREKSYAAMAKKGGTSFTLHHDRAVATQTG